MYQSIDNYVNSLAITEMFLTKGRGRYEKSMEDAFAASREAGYKSIEFCGLLHYTETSGES